MDGGGRRAEGVMFTEEEEREPVVGFLVLLNSGQDAAIGLRQIETIGLGPNGAGHIDEKYTVVGLLPVPNGERYERVFDKDGEFLRMERV